MRIIFLICELSAKGDFGASPRGAKTDGGGQNIFKTSCYNFSATSIWDRDRNFNRTPLLGIQVGKIYYKINKLQFNSKFNKSIARLQLLSNN